LVVPEIRVFRNGVIEFLICIKSKTVNQFCLQAVEIALHRRVVIWASGAAHALLNAVLITIENKTKRSKLAPLVGMQNKALRLDFLRLQGFIHGLDSKLAGNPFPSLARNHAAVIKVNNRAVISQSTI